MAFNKPNAFRKINFQGELFDTIPCDSFKMIKKISGINRNRISGIKNN